MDKSYQEFYQLTLPNLWNSQKYGSLTEKNAGDIENLWHEIHEARKMLDNEQGSINHNAQDIQFLYQDVKNKKAVLQEILEKEGLRFDQVAAIGDDLNDLSLLRAVGLSFAPADALPMVTESVNIVLTKEGGKAAVREMIDIVVEKENLSEAFVKLWL